jgi:4-amino-4-deoxy-L-arabinose transferase-like glycosyltransferase
VLLPVPRSFLAPPAALCPWLAALLIVGSAALRVAYLACDCPLDLAPDEAHYWDWSRHLDWSYYSKGPLVAWLIRASCELFGPLSERLTGNLALAIRLPAVACGALLLTALYVLTLRVSNCARLALAVVALGLTLPVLAAGSALMTIDAPYTCCWAWALVFAHRAVFRGGRAAWLLAGLFVGAGILAKYTMVVFLPSVGLFLLTSRQHRPLLRTSGPWLMAGVAALCCLPIAIWNAQHDWVTVRHVLALAGLAPRDSEGPQAEPAVTWLGPLAYLGGQCALLLVFWFLAWLVAMIDRNPLRDRDPGTRFLWWLSAPMFLVFFAFSLKTGGGELNWPITTYLSGLVLTAAWLGRQITSPVGWYRRWTKANIALTCAVGLALSLFVHFGAWFAPLLARLAGGGPLAARRLDPTCRLRGWRALAAEVDRAREEARAEGEPVLAASSWALPGELGAYCSGRPQAYSVGRALGDRHSQYDLWPGPLSDPEAFRGRTFVLVGGLSPELRAAFAEVGPPRTVAYAEGEQLIAVWQVTVCRGFRGLRPAGESGHY